jgi:hypothetical protein
VGEGVEQQIAAHLMTPPPRPSAMDAKLPGGFDAVIEKGLAKKPSDRFQTALQLADAARAALRRKKPSKAATPEKSTEKSLHSPRQPQASAPVSPSASTLMAPTRLANAVGQSGTVPSERRTVNAKAARDEHGSPNTGVFWAAMWIVVFGRDRRPRRGGHRDRVDVEGPPWRRSV